MSASSGWRNLATMFGRTFHVEEGQQKGRMKAQPWTPLISLFKQSRKLGCSEWSAYMLHPLQVCVPELPKPAGKEWCLDHVGVPLLGGSL